MIRFFLGNLLRPRLFIVAYFLTSFLSLGPSAPDASDSPARFSRSFPAPDRGRFPAPGRCIPRASKKIPGTVPAVEGLPGAGSKT